MGTQDIKTGHVLKHKDVLKQKAMRQTQWAMKKCQNINNTSLDKT